MRLLPRGARFTSEISREWFVKAEGDYHTALREFRARKHPNYDAACFHAQQCIEKILKGRLLAYGIAFPKIHDLEVLLDLALTRQPLWEPMRVDAQLLTNMPFSSDIPATVQPEKKLLKQLLP